MNFKYVTFMVKMIICMLTMFMTPVSALLAFLTPSSLFFGNYLYFYYVSSFFVAFWLSAFVFRQSKKINTVVYWFLEAIALIMVILGGSRLMESYIYFNLMNSAELAIISLMFLPTDILIIIMAFTFATELSGKKRIWGYKEEI